MISVRVDDFPHTKGEPQHTLEAFRRFDLCLRECIGGKRYILGVIPGRCTTDDLNFIRDETDCVVGMHGINHDESKLDLYGNEFPPFLSAEQIRSELKASVSALEKSVSRKIDIYMPPRNAIDGRTLSVLHSCGFERFTSGPGTSLMVIKNTIGIHIDSRLPHEYGRTDEMLSRGHRDVLISRALTEKIVLTLHWTWETNIGLDHMVKFFSQIPKDYFEDFR